MSDLLPCRFCRTAPNAAISVVPAADRHYVRHVCMGPYHTTMETAAAEWNAANAATDPALLALAVRHLAEWALAVDDDANWDGWDSYYKDARWNPGPLRELLDKAMDEIRAEEAAWTYHHEIATGQPDGADGAGEVGA